MVKSWRVEKQKHNEGFELSTATISSSSSQNSELIVRTMKHQCTSSSDRISILPSNITDIILVSLPLREIVRTSVLSRHWRYQWVTVPQLIVDESMERRHSRIWQWDKYNVNIVYEILLQHQGPLWKFSLDVTSWYSSAGMDDIIPILSRKGVNDLTLMVDKHYREYCDGSHELPSSIFSCVELKQLSLVGCVPQPLTLTGFNKLASVELLNMNLDTDVSIPCGPLLESLKLEIFSLVDYLSIDAPNLKSFFYEGCVFYECNILTPFLKVISLTTLIGIEEPIRYGEFEEIIEDPEIDLINLLRSWPLLENIHVSHRFRKGGSTNKLPNLLNNLVMLDLTQLNVRKDPSTVWLMKSSPNLQKLKIELSVIYDEDVVQFEFWRVENTVDCSLTNLREDEVTLKFNCDVAKFDFGFLEFLLASSPQLETLCIKLPDDVTVKEAVEIRRSRVLSELPSFHRASPKAQVVFIGQTESCIVPYIPK